MALSQTRPHGRSFHIFFNSYSIYQWPHPRLLQNLKEMKWCGFVCLVCDPSCLASALTLLEGDMVICSCHYSLSSRRTVATSTATTQCDITMTQKGKGVTMWAPRNSSSTPNCFSYFIMSSSLRWTWWYTPAVPILWKQRQDV